MISLSLDYTTKNPPPVNLLESLEEEKESQER